VTTVTPLRMYQVTSGVVAPVDGHQVDATNVSTAIPYRVGDDVQPEVFTPLTVDSFSWSGSTWTVKHGDNIPPQNNDWSRSSVALGDQGSLRMRVAPDSEGSWKAAEIVKTESVGYGTYSFTTTSSVIPTNINSVLGLFTYAVDSVNEGYEEIDIEYAQWGSPSYGPGSWSVHKPSPHYVQSYNLTYTGPLVHTFLWEPNSIHWTITRQSTGQILHENYFTGSLVPTYSAALMRINFWLMNGEAPSGAEPFEVIFSSATWTAL